ncbi:MAG: flippase [Planctomycetota bacterium]|nr:MAG: flippase [Planctomycetota bacterium]
MQSTSSQTLWRVFSNAGSLLTSEVLNKATTFLVYALVSRWLGAESFGQLSLGLLLFYVFQVVATAGLPTFVTRKVARHRHRTGRVVMGSLLAATLAGTVATAAMLVCPWMLQYPRDTTLVISVLAAGLLPYAWALVFESAFRGMEQMHWIAASNVAANVLKVAGALWMLTQGWGVLAIAAWIVMVRLTIALTDLFFYVLANGWLFRPVPWSYATRLLRQTSTFLGIDGLIAVWSAVDAVLLSKLMTETEVGIYSAAAQLLQPMLLVYRSIVGSLFPSMCARALGQTGEFTVLVRWMIAFLLLVGTPATVLLPLFADLILGLAYHNPQFQRAVPLMQIGAVFVLLQALTSVLGHSLWALHRERITLRIVVVNLVANVAVGILMISWLGMVGAALGSLLVGVLNAAQHYWVTRRLLARSPIDAQSGVPLLAGLAMAAVAIALVPLNRWLAAGGGLAVYAVAVAALLRQVHGDWSSIRMQYFVPLLGRGN